GSAAAGNATGVELQGTGDTVGGVNPGDGNLISGNSGPGISIDTGYSNGNTIVNNVIGLNAAQNAALPNLGGGVFFANGASQNHIGGLGTGNVIAGNHVFGVRMTGTQTSFNRLQANLIGLTPGGAAFPNPLGVDIAIGADNNQLGPD